MAAKTRPCTAPGCPYPKKARHPKFCVWHWLATQPIDEQVAWAKDRRRRALEAGDGMERVRVPDSEWPTGERWCSGCQSFVPLFYTTQARCFACASAAQHASRIQATYGISGEEYQKLWEWQGGRCYICRRKTTRRLAVDHDHQTGAVRGLLCADQLRGCNHAILGNIADLAMARRIVEYLESPPIERMRAGEALAAVDPQAAKKPTKKQREREAYQAALDRMFPSYAAQQGRPASPSAPEPPQAAQRPPVAESGGYQPRPFIDDPFL